MRIPRKTDTLEVHTGVDQSEYSWSVVLSHLAASKESLRVPVHANAGAARIRNRPIPQNLVRAVEENLAVGVYIDAGARVVCDLRTQGPADVIEGDLAAEAG